MTAIWKLIFIILILTNAVIWIAVLTYKPDKFRLIACDVGQGDAILATLGSFQILTDGGIPNGKAMECLSHYMPFWDRQVEVIVNTHPQLDHYGGLIEVMQNYKVLYFVGNSLDASASEYQVLKNLVGGHGITVINPEKGTSLRYGKIHYDIFFPSKDFLAKTFEGKPTEGFLADASINQTTTLLNYQTSSNVLGAFTSKRDPNDFSIQAVLSYGEFDALLTGDIGHNMEKEVVPQFLSSLVPRSIEYLKIPHHGSKYGITQDYLDVINPKIAVISVGAKNRYGHPTAEVIKLLSDKGIKLYRTDLNGDVVIESDGRSFEVK